MPDFYRSLKNRKASILGHQHLLKAAVLLPLVEEKGEVCVLFEERAHHLKRQPGEICFPGGRMEPQDETEWQTAMRETCEELGVEPDSIELIGALDYIVTPFLMIYPFAGKITEPMKIQPDPDEVASVFTVPISYLRTATPELHFVDVKTIPPEDFPFDWIPNGRNYKWRKRKVPEYFYFYEDRIIWGLTARILHHFLEITK